MKHLFNATSRVHLPILLVKQSNEKFKNKDVQKLMYLNLMHQNTEMLT